MARSMCLSFMMAHLFPARGPAFVREPQRFPALARMLECLSVRRGVTRRLIDASNVVRARLTARGVTFFDTGCFFEFRSEIRAAAWMGGVSTAAISTYTYHPQSNVISV